MPRNAPSLYGALTSAHSTFAVYPDTGHIVSAFSRASHTIAPSHETRFSMPGFINSYTSMPG